MKLVLPARLRVCLLVEPSVFWASSTFRPGFSSPRFLKVGSVLNRLWIKLSSVQQGRFLVRWFQGSTAGPAPARTSRRRFAEDAWHPALGPVGSILPTVRRPSWDVREKSEHDRPQ